MKKANESVKSNRTSKAVSQPQKHAEAKRLQSPHPYDIIVGCCLNCLPEKAGERRVVLESLDQVTTDGHPRKAEIRRMLKSCEITGGQLPLTNRITLAIHAASPYSIPENMLFILLNLDGHYPKVTPQEFQKALRSEFSTGWIEPTDRSWRLSDKAADLLASEN